jgi:hypothetical protein
LEGAVALAVEDAKVLKFGTQGRADWRALVNAALIGGGVGLALGGLYLGAGMGRAVIEHGRAERIAEVGQSLRGPLGADPAALTQAAAPAAAQLVSVKPTRAAELDCLTQAVYFEARGESARGQAAVATVVMNRVKNPHFPKTVCGVVYQGASHHNGCQFSFACDGAANRVVEWGAWAQARRVAARVLSGAALRDVGSATHYHTTAVDPEWGSRMLRVAQVGLHVFYRFNPHAPPPPELDDESDPPQFASREAPGQTLRLAAAVIAPAAEAAVPAAAEARLAAPVEAVPAPGPIVKTDAASAAKTEGKTTS